MRTYAFVSLLLAVVMPMTVLLHRPWRELFIHVGLIGFFHAMGALALWVGLNVFRLESAFWAWVLFAVSFNFYIGAVFFASLIRPHRADASISIMEDIRCQDPTEEILVEKRRGLWPLVLFPARPGAHTALFTGRRWVNGMKAGFGFSRLYLTNKRLLAQLVFPRVVIIDIKRADIGSVGFVDRQKDLIGIRYSKSRISAMTKLLVFSGTAGVRDLLLLNVGEDGQRWLAALTPASRA